MTDDQGAAFMERMSFIMEAFTLREIRGWPNKPAHNACIIHELRGWRFDEKDARSVRAEARARDREA